MMEYSGIPIIVIICYLIGEIFKLLILKTKNKYKYIPIIVGVSGGLIGLLTFYVSPELLMNTESPLVSVGIGIVSGFASCGSDQAIKQLLKKE
jgi:hypothetical protein